MSPSHLLSTRRPVVRAALIFAAWTAFGLLMAQQTALTARVRGNAVNWLETIATSMLGVWLWALYTPIVVPVTRALRRARETGWRGWLLAVVAHGALLVVLTCGDAVVYAKIRPLVDGVQTTIPRVFAAVMLLNVLLYAVVVTLVEAAEYARAYRERDRAAATLARTAADLRGKLDEARLHALESQLRPHFLYNTLNLIAELVHEEPETADEMLTRLGFLLRRACREGTHLVPLGEELATVRAYTDILLRRYGARVAIAIDVPAALHDRLVPVFSLQPLVENAFRHGVERRERATAVAVTATEQRGALVLRVTDRGVGPEAPLRDWPASVPRETPGGVGLRNTRERLAALFGDDAGLSLARSLDGADDVAVATLWLPSRAASDTDHSPVVEPNARSLPDLPNAPSVRVTPALAGRTP